MSADLTAPGQCCATEPGAGYRCSLPRGHVGDHRRELGCDDLGAIPPRVWSPSALLEAERDDYREAFRELRGAAQRYLSLSLSQNLRDMDTREAEAEALSELNRLIENDPDGTEY